MSWKSSFLTEQLKILNISSLPFSLKSLTPNFHSHHPNLSSYLIYSHILTNFFQALSSSIYLYIETFEYQSSYEIVGYCPRKQIQVWVLFFFFSFYQQWLSWKPYGNPSSLVVIRVSILLPSPRKWWPQSQILLTGFL